MRISDWSSDVCSSDLLELTSAFAAIAAGAYPVSAHGIADTRAKGWIERLNGGQSALPEKTRRQMLTLLQASVDNGPRRNEQLRAHPFGKTDRSAERRVEKEGGRKVISRWAPAPIKKTN